MAERLSASPGEGGARGILEVLWRRRTVIAGIAGAFTILTMLVSLVMPRVYVSRTSLLPPVSASSNLMAVPGMEASLGLLGIRDESASTAKLFEQILRSRTVMEEVIRKGDLIPWFHLAGRPEREAMEQAVVLLRGASGFGVTDAGLIEISVRFATPWFAGGRADETTRTKAAAVANEFVARLDAVNREKSLSRAKQTRIYLERQLAENVASIRKLGQDLASFQRTHGAVALDAQTKALVENAAQLKAQLLAKEVELGVARQSMTTENPVVAGLRTEVEQLRRSLSGLVGPASEDTTRGGRPDADLPAGEIPRLQVRLADYERELQAQLLLHSYLNQQYYQAKIQEARDAPTVQVLDPAVPPVERFSPKRKLMTLGGLLSGTIVGLLAAALLEGIGLPRRRGSPGAVTG